MSLYRISEKWESGFGHFWRFLNFGPFFGPFLGTVVGNSKHKKGAPGNSIKIKILILIFGSQKCVFPKCTFLGPQLSRSGLVWYLLYLWKAPAPRGLDNKYKADWKYNPTAVVSSDQSLLVQLLLFVCVPLSDINISSPGMFSISLVTNLTLSTNSSNQLSHYNK